MSCSERDRLEASTKWLRADRPTDTARIVTVKPAPSKRQDALSLQSRGLSPATEGAHSSLNTAVSNVRPAIRFRAFIVRRTMPIGALTCSFFESCPQPLVPAICNVATAAPLGAMTSQDASGHMKSTSGRIGTGSPTIGAAGFPSFRIASPPAGTTKTTLPPSALQKRGQARPASQSELFRKR